MHRLQSLGLVEAIRKLEQPVLGICLGMQLLFESSEEGDTPSLGLVPGRVALLPESPGVTVPHMGWNTLDVRQASPLLRGFDAATRFYFVHSFAGPVNEFTVASCTHGTAFAAVVRRGNFWGAQFHPERSGAAGAQFLKNFLEMPA